MHYKKRQAAAVALSIFGIVGTIGTAWLTRKATARELKEFGSSGFSKKSKESSTKDILKIYAPVIVVGSATIASIISSAVLSRKTEASLISMALMADQGWRKYKYQVKKLIGDQAHTDILKGIAKEDSKSLPDDIPEDNRRLYFEEHVGFFLADPEALAYAYGDMNQRLQVEEVGVSSYYTMLYDFVKDFELLDKKLDKENLQWGWLSYDLNQKYGYAWVHWFLHEDEMPDGTKYTVIEWGEELIFNPSNYGECWLDDDYHEQDSSYSPVQRDKKLKE